LAATLRKEILMAHEAFRNALVSLAGTTAADPSGFLDGLSPIHAAWHAEGSRTYGFLLFHTRVVRYFNQIVGPVLQSQIEPFTPNDFQNMDVDLFEYDVSSVDALAELRDFSIAIESWHNTAHMGIEMATGTPMMDPRQNIFFRPFWQLHGYIDELFNQTLVQYGQRAHPGQFVTDSAIAAHIEAAHHGWVPRI
jgi:hypothetical protein